MDYLKSQKVIHWLMAIAIMIDLNVAQKFGGEMQLWDRLESRAGHYGLYILMGALVLTGIISATYASDPVLIFNSYDLAFANHNDDVFKIVRGIHEFCTNAIIALIVIHILAAIYHHFVLKDSTTSNMTKFWTTKKQ